MRRHHVERVAGLELVADPVGKDAAGDPLDGDLSAALVGATHSE
jgi:hypothetical protein